jgi:hypothetical protein
MIFDKITIIEGFEDDQHLKLKNNRRICKKNTRKTPIYIYLNVVHDERDYSQSIITENIRHNLIIIGEIHGYPTTFWKKVFFIEFFVLVGRKVDRK